MSSFVLSIGLLLQFVKCNFHTYFFIRNAWHNEEGVECRFCYYWRPFYWAYGCCYYCNLLMESKSLLWVCTCFFIVYHQVSLKHHCTRSSVIDGPLTWSGCGSPSCVFIALQLVRVAQISPRCQVWSPIKPIKKRN